MMETHLAARLSGMADGAAARLCRRRQTVLLEQEDVRQELLLDLLLRLPNFDPKRSPFTPFVILCFRHRSARLSRAAAANTSPVTLPRSTPLSQGRTA